MPLTQSDVRRQIMSDRDLSQRFRDGQEILAIQGYKQYLGYRRKLEENEKHRSNLHIPLTYRIVDTIRAREVKAICGSRPYVDAIIKPGPNSRPELMLENEQKSKIAAALLDQQLALNKFVSLAYDYSTAKLIFPVSILGVCWEHEEDKRKKRVQFELAGMKFPFAVTKEENEILFDDNRLFYVDLWDYWWDPWAGTQDIGRHSFGIYRQFMTKDEIENNLEFFKSQGMGKVFMPTRDDWAKIQEIEVKDNRFQRFSEVELETPSNEGIDADSAPGNNSANRRYAVYAHWTRNELKWIINDSFVPVIGDNPFWRHKQIPFAMQSFERMPGEVCGRSASFFIHHLQEEINTQRNQRLDNVALIINCMWQRKSSSEVTDAELVSKPGGIIEVNEIGEVQPFTFPDVTSASVREDQIAVKEAEDTLGSPAITQGLAPSGDPTATQIQSQNNNASIRIDVKIMLLAEPWERTFGLMDMNNQQLITDQRMVEMFGEDGVKRWQEMGPLDIIGYERDYTIASAKADPSVNREIKRQQLWNTIAEGMQLGLNLDFEGLVTEWLKTMDFSNPEKYKLSPEDIEAKAKAAAEQQMAQQTEAAGQEQQAQQQKFQQDMVMTVIQIIGKLVEKNPMLLSELSGLMPAMAGQGGEQQLLG